MQRSGKFVPGYKRTTFKFTSSSKGKGKRFKGRFPKGKGKGIRAIIDGDDVYLVEDEDEHGPESWQQVPDYGFGPEEGPVSGFVSELQDEALVYDYDLDAA